MPLSYPITTHNDVQTEENGRLLSFVRNKTGLDLRIICVGSLHKNRQEGKFYEFEIPPDYGGIKVPRGQIRKFTIFLCELSIPLPTLALQDRGSYYMQINIERDLTGAENRERKASGTEVNFFWWNSSQNYSTLKRGN